MGYKEISDYGIIGNLFTCALVGRDGSVDWCCLPHLDSPSVFAAVLDVGSGGHFRVSPVGEAESEQRYREDTNVLETHFRAPTGSLTLTDFMPVSDDGSTADKLLALYRRARCTSGTVEVELDLYPRFDYARAPTRCDASNGLVMCEGGGERAFLWTSRPVSTSGIRPERIQGTWELREGEELWLVFSFGREPHLAIEDCGEALMDTERYWRDWIHRCPSEGCVFDGPWHDLVARSGLALKLLTYPHTGAIAAAATTSLPEEIGGGRNWDYRYVWVRDASFTVQALFNMGHFDEAEGFLDWCVRVFERQPDPSALRVLYGLHDHSDLTERVLGHLEGYRNSRPVRIGNEAAGQRQLDIYGELVDAAYQTTRYGRDLRAEAWPTLCRYIDHVCEIWTQKGSGIWEMRGEERHFIYSKVMCWVALDRGLRIAGQKGWPGDLALWRKTAGEIRDFVLREGYDPQRGSFVQSAGSKYLDSANLLLPLVGFLPFDDPRVQGTIDATQRELGTDGLVERYQGDDGLEGQEGAFLLCTFWLIDCLALSGRIEEARDLFLDVTRRVGPLGLLSEEVDPRSGALLGNFPQAFSHIGLINSALYLGKLTGKPHRGPEPMGVAET